MRVSNRYGIEKSNVPGIYCVAHQHASEMSGAWALQGFLAEVAGRADNAPITWAVPILNIDGTMEGDYGKDPFPWDFNRAWGYPPMRIEVKACMVDISLWKTRCEPLIYLDFHSPGACENDGVYAYIPQISDSKKQQLLKSYANKIRKSLARYSAPNFIRVASYPSRFKTDQHMNFGKFYSQEDSIALSFEIPYNRICEKILQIDDYLEIGARIARAICDFRRTFN